MAYTYDQYLKDQESESKPPVETKKYTYDQYLADQEEEKSIREWLKTQNREDVPITPEIKKRYERQRDFAIANPDAPSGTGYGLKNFGEEAKQVVSERVASIADLAGRLGIDIASTVNPVFAKMAPTVKSKIAQTTGEMMAGTDEMARERGLPEGSLAKKAVDAGLGTGIDIAAKYSNPYGFGVMFGENVYGGMSGDVSGESVRQKINAGIGVGAPIDERSGGEQFADTLRGAKEGAKQVAFLKTIGAISKLLPKGVSRPIFEGTAFAASSGGTIEDRISNGLIGAFFGWKKRKENYINPETQKPFTAREQVNKYIDDVKTKMGGKYADQVFNDKFERSLRRNLEREETWQEKQYKIQEQDVLNKFDKLPQEMTAQEKAAELAALQERAKVEFGEGQIPAIERTGATEIAPPGGASEGISGKSEPTSEPTRNVIHGGVGGEGMSIEELNAQPAVRIKFDSYGEPSNIKAGPGGEIRAGGAQPEKNERIFIGDPITKTVYDTTNGVPIEVTDPKIIKAATDSGVFVRHNTEVPENIVSESTLPTAEERAALVINDIPSATGEMKNKPRNATVKPADMAAPKPPPVVEKSTKPVEPQTVTNLHAAKTVRQVADIRNTTEELTEMMGEAATHQKMNLAEQGRMAHELPEGLARDVALGKRKAPEVKGSDGHFLKEEAVWVAEKNRAIASGDVDYLMELAKNSPVQEQISQSGKSLVLLRGHAPNDPVYQIMEINKTAKETIEKNLGNKKVAEATTKRVAELERIIAEQTKKIEDYENRKTIREIRYEARKSGRKLTTEQLKTEFDDLANILNKQISTQMNIGLDPKVIRLIGKMTVNRMEAGVVKIEQIVDDVYTALGGKLDRRAIRDAITGYGRTSQLSKDEINEQLREAKRQGRLISQLEDAERGLAPLRSGLQRDKPSERVKELRRQVEEAMRKNGLLIEKELKEKKERIPPTEEERQLTAIEKYKNYIKKRTAELETRLAEGDYSVKPRKVTPIDNELQRKKDHVSRISKEYNKLKELNEIRSNGVTKEEAKEIIRRSQVVSEKKAAVKDWNDRSVDGAAMEYGRSLFDFYDHANSLKQRARKVTMREWGKKAMHGEFLKTGWHGIKTASGVSKSILSSMDNSAIGRQGIKTLWNHPGAWYKNAKQSFVDLFGKHDGKTAMREVMADVLSRPNAINGTYGKMKLDVGNIEEAYPEQAPEKIPGFGKLYKRSEAAFVGFQYRTRADVADIYLKIAEGYGNMKAIDMTSKDQLESIGRLVNTLTGRGHLGKSAERASESLNNVFFAPKFLKSNWDILTAHRFTNDTPFVKKQAALNLARFAAGTAASLAIAKALGADVELDPRSSDFLKVRVGNTRWDITGGVSSVATFASRLLIALGSSAYQMAGGEPLMATKSSVTGKLSPLTTPEGFKRNGLDLLVDFARGKLAPGASIMTQMLSGMDLNRKELNIGNLLLHALLPIGWQNAIENMSAKDKKIAVAAFLTDFVGVGASTYGKEKKGTVWKKFN